MATRDTPFEPGTPCWVDLFTGDPDRAKDFYGAVFGWDFEDSGEEFGGYVLARSDGHQVAGLMKNTGESGAPDTWSTYLATTDVDSTVATATSAGASVLVAPMEVGPLGKMAYLIAPAGGTSGAGAGRARSRRRTWSGSAPMCRTGRRWAPWCSAWLRGSRRSTTSTPR